MYAMCYVCFKCALVCVETFARALCTYATMWERIKGNNEVFGQ